MNNPVTTEVEIKVPFHDTDPMGVVWHGNYFRYFEVARCQLLDQIDYNYIAMMESGYTWPVVDTRVKFVRSAFFQQIIVVRVTLIEYENRLKLNYEIRNSDGEIITKGYTIQVAVDNESGEMCYRSPAILFSKLSIEAPK
jgi:acyl-CoA thioester hydrolase